MSRSRLPRELLAVTLVGLAALLGQIRSEERVAEPPPGAEPRWWKGNLHTHSFWSDGDDFPESIVAWYKDRGYHFLALSDHNVLSEGERWVDAETHAKGAIVEALPKYRERFGNWVEERSSGGRATVRLKPLSEFRTLFERPGQFLLIQSEEITDKFEKLPVHLNATNLRDLILPQGGDSVREVLQRNIDAVLEQRRRTGQPMFVHINHPNYGWGVTADDMIGLKGERFFEVYNGHSGTRNYGDAEHPSTERMWDLVLAVRLAQPDGEIFYGLATDDAHNYHKFEFGRINPGRGWVMVRSRYLTAESIVLAMEQGDFYASTGVRLRDIRADERQLEIEIDPEPDVRYETEFVGTLRAENAGGDGGDPIGRVLATSSDMRPVYEFRGNELYVRARVRSSRAHPNPYAKGDVESAWTQPVLPQSGRRP